MGTHEHRLATRAAVAALVAGLALAAGFGFASAQDASALSLENPRVRVTIPGRPAAGYVTIGNSGEADALVSARSPRAERIELHTHLMEDGVMKMREVEKVNVPARGIAEFKPGGFHLMIFGLDSGVKPGDSLSLTLTFDKAGNVEAEFSVEGLQ